MGRLRIGGLDLTSHGKRLRVTIAPSWVTYFSPEQARAFPIITNQVAAGAQPWIAGYPDRDFRLIVEITRAGTAEGLVVAATPSTGGQPLVKIAGTPAADYDGLIVVETTGPRGTATFSWSVNGGATWGGTLVPTAASVALGTTGLVAEFDPGTYTATITYVWPMVALFRYSTDDGATFSAIQRASVAGTSLLGTTIKFTGFNYTVLQPGAVPPFDYYRVGQTKFWLRGMFRIIVSDADKPFPSPQSSNALYLASFPIAKTVPGVEGWELYVDSTFWFLIPTPESWNYEIGHSDLIAAAQWVSEERPPFGDYEIPATGRVEVSA